MFRYEDLRGFPSIAASGSSAPRESNAARLAILAIGTGLFQGTSYKQAKIIKSSGKDGKEW